MTSRSSSKVQKTIPQGCNCHRLVHCVYRQPISIPGCYIAAAYMFDVRSDKACNAPSPSCCWLENSMYLVIGGILYCFRAGLVQVQAGCAGADRRAARGGLQVRQEWEQTASFLYDDHTRMLYTSSISFNSKCLACFSRGQLWCLWTM